MKLLKTLFRSSLRYLIILLFVICFAEQSKSQDSAGIGFFNSDEILAIILKTDLKNLINNKKDGNYQKAELIINNKSYSIRLKTRGKYRLENCSFPPLTLNFSKTEFDDNSNEHLTKLKLVNACKMQKTYAQYVFREYLIYKTFNLMTENSFKVRLMKIEYIDTSEKMKPVTQYGFVIEDQHTLADRLDGVIIKKRGLKDQVTNNEQIIMLSVFMFMIGNTDWQVADLQNLKLLKLNNLTEPAPYVIPYDFDYTGMVNATYAIPAPVLGIDNIRERLYWGKCYSEENLLAAVEKFHDNKEEIYLLYQSFTMFDKGSLNHSISYLDSFYKIIENEKRWKNYFINKCKD